MSTVAALFGGWEATGWNEKCVRSNTEYNSVAYILYIVGRQRGREGLAKRGSGAPPEVVLLLSGPETRGERRCEREKNGTRRDRWRPQQRGAPRERPLLRNYSPRRASWPRYYTYYGAEQIPSAGQPVSKGAVPGWTSIQATGLFLSRSSLVARRFRLRSAFLASGEGVVAAGMVRAPRDSSRRETREGRFNSWEGDIETAQQARGVALR